MAKIDLSIFDKNHQHYLQIDKIQQWMLKASPILQELTAEALLKIFIGLAELNIFDNKFITNLCRATSTKLSDLSYSDLSSLLYALQELKYNKNQEFIQNIVTRLIQLGVAGNIEPSPTAIWVLSKIGFHDDEFFKLWLKAATPAVNNFDSYELTKSVQAIATLKLFDEEFISLLLSKLKNSIKEFEPRAKLNIAFYLSMISVNSFSDNKDLLKLAIDKFIEVIMRELDLDVFEDNISKQQILQIHSSKLYQLNPEKFDHLSRELRKHQQLYTSIIQKNVEKFIKRTYPDFNVVSEYYDINTASFIDLKVVRDKSHPECDVYLQVEGPMHYFINHQPSHQIPIFNAATEFRNKIHALHSINPYIISYSNIDNKNYRPNLLATLNTYPVGYVKVDPFAGAISSDLLSLSISCEGESSSSASAPTAPTLNLRNVHPRSKKKSGAKDKNPLKNTVIDNAEFDQLLEEFRQDNQNKAEEILSYQSLEQKYKKKAPITPKAILKQAIKSKKLEEIEIVLQHHNNKIPNGLDSQWYNNEDNAIDLFQLTLNNLSDDYQKSKIYIEIYNLFLSYNYQVTAITESHLKALIYSFGYGDAQIFQRFLSLFPDNDKKTQLMEYFFVNCGSLNHVEIADLLLMKDIEINSCYSRESAEVLYALSTGKKHTGSNIPYMNSIFSQLYKILTKEDPLRSVEDLLQVEARGNLDKGENIPKGRGVTALHLSSYRKEENSEIRLFLLKKGANPNTINKDGFTPLITALLTRSEEAALQILAFEPNVNLKAVSDLTAAHIAAKYGFVKAMQRIIDLKGNLNVKIQIEGATQASNTISITNADKKTVDFYVNETALWIALKEGHIDLAEYIIKAKAKVNLNLNSYLEINLIPYFGCSLKLNIIDFKYSILTYSIARYPTLVEELLKNGAKVNDPELKHSALIIAAEFSNPDTQYKAAMRSNDPNPQGAYDKAIEFRKYRIFEQLLMHGADINFKDKDGDTVDAYVPSPDHQSVHSKIIATIRYYELREDMSLSRREQILSHFGIKIASDHERITIGNTVMYSKSAEGEYDILSGFGVKIEDVPNLKAIENDSENIKANKGASDKISFTSLSMEAKIIDIIVDISRLANRPNMKIAYKLVYDVSQMSNILSGHNPTSLLITMPHIANKITDGKYWEAAMDITMSIGLGAINGLIQYVDIPYVKEFYPVAQELLMQSQTLKNMDLLYEEVYDPHNSEKSAQAYQNIRDNLANIKHSVQVMIGIDTHSEA